MVIESDANQTYGYRKVENLSASVVIGGLFLVLLSERLNVPWLAKADAVAALGVAGIVVYVSLQLGHNTITKVRLLAARYGLSAHNILMYDILNNRSLDMHLEVQESSSVDQAHQQVTEFEQELRKSIPGLFRIATHIEPVGDATATRQAKPVDEAHLTQAIKRIAVGER